MQKHLRSKVFAIVGILVFIANVYAGYNVSLVSQSGDETLLKYSVDNYEVTKVRALGESCDFVSLQDANNLNEKGQPALPYFTRSLAVSGDAEMAVEVTDVQYKEVAVGKLLPAKGVIFRNQNPADVPYTFGKVYSEDRYYPEVQVSLSEPFLVRDVRGVTVKFVPFQYNPQRVF